MKKFLLFMLLFFPVMVNAYEVKIDCPSSTFSGNTFECSIIGEAGNKYVSSLSGKIGLSENLELINFTPDSIWQGDGELGNIDLYVEENRTGSFRIGTVSVRVKNSSNVGNSCNVLIKDVKFFDDNFEDIKVKDISSSIDILSDNNYLSLLAVYNGKISPSFDKNVNSYKATIWSNSVRIIATPSSNKTTVTGDGVHRLNYGSNEFIIKVTSQAGSIREYKLIVTRPEDKYEVDNNIGNNDDNKLDDIFEEDNINDYINIGEIKKDSDSSLKSLSINDKEIILKDNVYDYSIDVSENVTSANVRAMVNGYNANVIIDGGDALTPGNNYIKITIVAENGNKSIYNILVKRKIDSNCLLKSLNVKGYDIDFDSNIFEYILLVDKLDDLEINAIPNNNSSKVEVLNNNNLKNGSVIGVKVSSDNNEIIYDINVLEKTMVMATAKIDKTLLYVGIIMVVVSLGFFVRKIVKKKENKIIKKKEVKE